MENNKLCVVIPAYNEQDTIEGVVREWYEIVEKYGDDSVLLVVDDGSRDATLAKLFGLAEELPKLTVITKDNEGHGATVLRGYYEALALGAGYIFQTDSDGQTSTQEFDGFWYKRGIGKAVIGWRSERQDGLSRVFVTKVLKFTLKLIFKVDVTDANTPYRLMERSLLERYITKVPKGYNLTNVLLSVMFVKNKEDVSFQRISFKPRQGGKNSINLIKIFKIGIQAVKDFKSLRSVVDNK